MDFHVYFCHLKITAADGDFHFMWKDDFKIVHPDGIYLYQYCTKFPD